MAGQQRNNTSNQVAVIQPPRMQMPAHVATDYDLNEDSWRALTDAVFPLAKSVGAVILALAYCKRHRLDVFQKVVHIVPMRVGGRTVETVWPGIGQIRVTAQRQESFAGYDECEFGPDIEQTFTGKKQRWDNGNMVGWDDLSVTMVFPEWAQFVVYKMLHGQRIRLPGPKVYFVETFASKSAQGGDVPNERWERAPRQMIEKCAEAAGYRRAFPDVLGNEMSAEEMEGRHLDGAGAIDAEYVEVETGDRPITGQAKPAPKRGDYQRGATTGNSDKGKPEPEQEGERTAGVARDPLDGTSIPETEVQWADFIKRLTARLAKFSTRNQVDSEQERQQFRIDAASIKLKQELYSMFADRGGELELEPADDAPAEDAEDAAETAEGDNSDADGHEGDGQSADEDDGEHHEA